MRGAAAPSAATVFSSPRGGRRREPGPEVAAARAGMSDPLGNFELVSK
jgi:hypothetical protein